MKAAIITDLDSLEPVEDAWRALAELRGNAFVTPDWYRAWWAHYGEPGGLVPAVSVVRSERGDLAGVLPLAVSPHGALRPGRFAGANLGDWFHPVAAPGDEADVAVASIRALEASPVDWRTLILDHVPAGNEWLPAMIGGASRRLRAVSRSPAQLPKVDLAGLSWDGYLAASSSGFRKRLRYLERSLSRDHEVRVRQSDNPAALAADLDAFFEMHNRRWEDKGGSWIGTAAATAMLSDFARAALSRGWLRLRFLEVDGVAVAVFLGWRLGERYSFYQAGFDPRWAKHSVGLLLVAMTLRNAIGEGAGEFDLLLGDEDYKWRLAHHSKDAVTTTIVAANHPLRVLVGAESVARRVGRRLAVGPAGDALRSLGSRLPTSTRS